MAVKCKTIQGPSFIDVTDDSETRKILHTLVPEDPTCVFHGEYGIERWNHEANPVGVDYHDIKGKIYILEKNHFLIVGDDKSNDPIAVYRIETSDGGLAHWIADDLFQDHCDTFAPTI